jgi:hypothetical protein
MPPFGHFRDQAGGGGRAAATHAGEQVGEIGVMTVDVPGQFRFDLIELGTDRDDHGPETLSRGGMTARQPLLFGDAHGHELPAAAPGRTRRLSALPRGNGFSYIDSPRSARRCQS